MLVWAVVASKSVYVLSFTDSVKVLPGIEFLALCFEVSLARRQNHKLAWEGGTMEPWKNKPVSEVVSHRSVRPCCSDMRRASGESFYKSESAVS